MSANSAHMSAAVAGCIEACDRFAGVLDAVSETQYRDVPPGRSSIAAHLRHALEHMDCLLRGVRCGTVDYDARPRDPELERDPRAARATIDRLRAALEDLDPSGLECRITVRESTAPDSAPEEAGSTVARELAFVSGHAIHHLEIAGLIAALQGIDLPTDWGVAFSTAAWQAGQGD